MSILNSLENTINKSLHNFDKKFHSKINDSLVDDFIHDLESHLDKQDSIYKLSALPQDTIFWLDRYEGDYAVCGIKDTCNMYDIPKDMISDSLNEGDFLTLGDDRKISFNLI